MNTTSRKTIFKHARAIESATGKSFAVCLAKAWQLHRFAGLLSRGNVSFLFEKADGSLRRATGTLKEAEKLVKGTGKKTYRVFCYFDVEKNAFRSFRVENFICIR